MSDEYQLQELKVNREHVSMALIGHVSAGKSTISGRILIDTENIDKCIIEKSEKEANERSLESLDLSSVHEPAEDRPSKGETQKCSVSSFEIPNKRITLLDAPGYAVLTGAAQADIVCFVISACKGEFEAGLDQGEPTLAHLVLASTMVRVASKILICVNKMDDPTVAWSQERYDEIVSKLTPRFEKFGYDAQNDLAFFPASGLTGAGLKDRVKTTECSWYDGPSLFELLAEFPPFQRNVEAPVRISVSSAHKDLGVFSVTGKLHAGVLNVGDELISVPSMNKGTVTSISIDFIGDADSAQPVENLTLTLTGFDKDDIAQGSILCTSDKPCCRAKIIEGRLISTGVTYINLAVFDGTTFTMHIHTATVECQILAVLGKLSDNGGGIVRIKLDDVIALDKISGDQPLACFYLLDGEKLIACGRVFRVRL